MYTLDTNVIIYYLDGKDSAAEILRPIFASDASVYISAMSELELLSLPSLQHDEFMRIGQFIRRLVTVPLDSRIARIASTLRRRHHIKSPDAAIAATAMLTGSTLITRNVKDFSQLTHIRVQPVQRFHHPPLRVRTLAPTTPCFSLNTDKTPECQAPRSAHIARYPLRNNSVWHPRDFAERDRAGPLPPPLIVLNLITSK